MRLPFMKKYNIEEFEFSQSYLFFWDKVTVVWVVIGLLMQSGVGVGTELLLGCIVLACMRRNFQSSLKMSFKCRESSKV